MPPKYAHLEIERRFLLRHLPADAVTRTRRIADRYLLGTALRLRQLSEPGQPTIFKLTQKLPDPANPQHHSVTTIYLTEPEFAVLSQLPALTLAKTRLSVPPFGVDVFEGPLHGLLLAEAEFPDPFSAAALALPPFLFREVTADLRFTGGRLASTSRPGLLAALAAYGLTPPDPSPC